MGHRAAWTPAQGAAIARALDDRARPGLAAQLVYAPGAEIYQTQLEHAEALVRDFFGRPLPRPVRLLLVPGPRPNLFAHVEPRCPVPGHPERSTGWFDTRGDVRLADCGCDLHLYPFGESRTTPAVQEILIHELTHCYQNDAFRGTVAEHVRTQLTSPWRDEGFAYWVESRLARPRRGFDEGVFGAVAEEGWFDYLGGDRVRIATSDAEPGSYRLFRATYSAVGFWEHVYESGGDLRHEGLDLVNTSGAVPIFARALALARDGSLDAWASSTLMEPGWNGAWALHHPIARTLPVRRPARQLPPLTPARGVDEAAGVGVQRVLEVPAFEGVEVLIVEGYGFGRISFHGETEFAWHGRGRQVYCLLADGCPGGPPLPLATPPRAGDGIRHTGLVIALAGGPTGPSHVVITGTTVDRFRRDNCPAGRWRQELGATRDTLAPRMPGVGLRFEGGVRLTLGADGALTDRVERLTAVTTAHGMTARATLDGTITGRWTREDARIQITGLRESLRATSQVSVGGRTMEVPLPGDPAAAFGLMPLREGVMAWRCEGDVLTLTSERSHTSWRLTRDESP